MIRTVRARLYTATDPAVGATLTATPQIPDDQLGRVAAGLVLPTVVTAAPTDQDGETSLDLWPYADWLPHGILYRVEWAEDIEVSGYQVGDRTRSVLVGILDQDGLWLHDPRLQVPAGGPFRP